MVDLQEASPIIVACAEGHIKIVQHLSAACADINDSNAKGETCIMAAAQAGHEEVALVLHDMKADIHAVSKDGFDLVMYAAASEDATILKLLTRLIRLSRERKLGA